MCRREAQARGAGASRVSASGRAAGARTYKVCKRGRAKAGRGLTRGPAFFCAGGRGGRGGWGGRVPGRASHLLQRVRERLGRRLELVEVFARHLFGKGECLLRDERAVELGDHHDEGLHGRAGAAERAKVQVVLQVLGRQRLEGVREAHAVAALSSERHVLAGRHEDHWDGGGAVGERLEEEEERHARLLPIDAGGEEFVDQVALGALVDGLRGHAELGRDHLTDMREARIIVRHVEGRGLGPDSLSAPGMSIRGAARERREPLADNEECVKRLSCSEQTTDRRAAAQECVSLFR